MTGDGNRLGGRIGQVGRAAEAKAANRLGGRQTAASGATRAKGDIELTGVLVEVKSTVTGTLRLDYEWLVKIAKEAVLTGRKPALSILFTDDAGRPRHEGAWVLVPEEMFREASS